MTVSTLKPTINTVEANSIEEVATALAPIMQINKVPGSNCTAAWKKADCPAVGSAYFDVFVAEHLQKKTRNAIGMGCYIVNVKGSENKLKNKFKLVQAPLNAKPVAKLNKDGEPEMKDGKEVMINENAPKYKMVYEVVEAELIHTVKEIKSEHEAEVTDKETGEVKKVMKESVKTIHEGKLVAKGAIMFETESQKEAKEMMRDLINENHRDYIIRKIKTSQMEVSTFGFYVESKGAQLGTYTAFGIANQE